MIRDIVLVNMGEVVGYAEVFSEEIYVCELFEMDFWEMCMHLYISSNNSLLSTQTPLKEVKAVYSS